MHLKQHFSMNQESSYVVETSSSNSQRFKQSPVQLNQRCYIASNDLVKRASLFNQKKSISVDRRRR